MDSSEEEESFLSALLPGTVKFQESNMSKESNDSKQEKNLDNHEVIEQYNSKRMLDVDEELKMIKELDETSFVRFVDVNYNELFRELFYICATGASDLKPAPKYPKYKEEETLSNEELVLDEDELEAMKREKEYAHEKTVQGIRDGYVIECLEMLYSKGIDLNVTDVQGMTPLHLLAMLGAPKAIEWSIEHGAKIHVKGLHGGTPLFWAAHCRKEECIKVLAKHGANVNTMNSYGESALQVAALKVRHLPAVQALKECGAIIPEALLLRAIEKPENRKTFNLDNCLSILQYLTKNKSDLKFSVVDDEGNTSILKAASYWIEAFRVMWKAISDRLNTLELKPNSKTKETLLRLIIRYGDFYLDQSCIDKLLEKGHSINEVDADGNTLLHEALNGNEGININVIDKNGETSLHKAIKMKDQASRLKFVRILLNAKIDPEIKNKEGKTAFELLTDSFEDTTVKTLFEQKKKSELSLEQMIHKSEGPLLTGFLHRIAGPLKLWKKFYCELRESELLFFAEKNMQEKKGIPLRDITSMPQITTEKVSKSKLMLYFFKVQTNDRIYFLGAETEDLAKKWFDCQFKKFCLTKRVDELLKAITTLSKETRKARFAYLSASELLPVSSADFSGTWELDLKSSESMESITRIMGKSTIGRKMEEKLPVTQIITHSAYELKIESRIKAAVKGAKAITEQLASRGIKITVPNEALFKSWTEVFIIDGTETIKTVDNVKMKLSFSWSHDRQVLIGTMILPDKGVLITHRFLETYDKMVYTLLLKTDGKSIGPIKRVFNRKKPEK